MKAILEFNLDDSDDNLAHFRCIKSLDMALALFEFSNWLRTREKYGEEKENIEDICKDFYEILEEHGLKLDDLVT